MKSSLRNSTYWITLTPKVLWLLLIISIVSPSGFSQETELSIFDNLVDKTWKASGNWESGAKFEQEISMDYSLDGKIVIVNTKGFIDPNQTVMGLRNHGIRMYDRNSGKIKFWEFDIFGGVTEGIVFAREKNIFYQYLYADTMLTEMWEYVNDSSYNLQIGVYQNETWAKIFLNTQLNTPPVEKH